MGQHEGEGRSGEGTEEARRERGQLLLECMALHGRNVKAMCGWLLTAGLDPAHQVGN